MKLRNALIASAFLSTFAGTVLADQAVGEILERNVRQQIRIEKGLRSGELTTEEASGLQRDLARIARIQADALDDGVLTDTERQRIQLMQDRASEDIYYERHNRQTGNPDSPSTQRMLAGVERNIRQLVRIARGADSGELTAPELAQLLQGQARLNWRQARFAQDGWIDREEQARIDYAQNRQSERIWEQKHDQSTRW